MNSKEIVHLAKLSVFVTKCKRNFRDKGRKENNKSVKKKKVLLI